MPTLPPNATPNRTCPDRAYCPEKQSTDPNEKCAYLAAAPKDRPDIQQHCLQHKKAIEERKIFEKELTKSDRQDPPAFKP